MDPSQPVIRDFTPSPIEEPALKNKGSCLWKLISLIITVVILATVIFSLISIFYSGPTIERVAALPAHFPTDIPLYRFGDRSAIHYQNAKENDKLFNRLAQIPKYLFGPIILKFRPDLDQEGRLLRNSVQISSSINYGDFKKLLQPSTNHNLDIIEIDWENLNDQPKKLFDFYKKNLTSQDYKITTQKTGRGIFQLTFEKEKTGGEVLITADEEKNITQKAILKVNFSPSK